MNSETYISICNNICNFESNHFCLKAHWLWNVFNSSSSSIFCINLGLWTYNYHSSRFKTQNSTSRLSFSHNDCRKSFSIKSWTLDFLCNIFKVKFTLNLHFSKWNHILNDRLSIFWRIVMTTISHFILFDYLEKYLNSCRSTHFYGLL